jgi:hypothetical protein
MSAIGMSQGLLTRAKPRIISAHADHRRTDFIFSRTQSVMLRETPWERRLKPMHSWSEICAYGAATFVAATALAVTLF